MAKNQENENQESVDQSNLLSHSTVVMQIGAGSEPFSEQKFGDDKIVFIQKPGTQEIHYFYLDNGKIYGSYTPLVSVDPGRSGISAEVLEGMQRKATIDKVMKELNDQPLHSQG